MSLIFIFCLLSVMFLGWHVYGWHALSGKDFTPLVQKMNEDATCNVYFTEGNFMYYIKCVESYYGSHHQIESVVFRRRLIKIL